MNVSLCLCVHMCRGGYADNDHCLRKVRGIGSISDF